MSEDTIEYLLTGAEAYTDEIAITLEIEKYKRNNKIVPAKLFRLQYCANYCVSECVNELLDSIPENAIDEVVSCYSTLCEDDSLLAIPPFLKLVKEEHENRKASIKRKEKN